VDKWFLPKLSYHSRNSSSDHVADSSNANYRVDLFKLELNCSGSHTLVTLELSLPTLIAILLLGERWKRGLNFLKARSFSTEPTIDPVGVQPCRKKREREKERQTDRENERTSLRSEHTRKRKHRNSAYAEFSSRLTVFTRTIVYT